MYKLLLSLVALSVCCFSQASSPSTANTLTYLLSSPYNFTGPYEWDKIVKSANDYTLYYNDKKSDDAKKVEAKVEKKQLEEGNLRAQSTLEGLQASPTNSRLGNLPSDFNGLSSAKTVDNYAFNTPASNNAVGWTYDRQSEFVFPDMT